MWWRLRIMPMTTLIAAGLMVPAPALADAVVVRATGPSAATYPVGRRLAPTSRVVLRAGDRLVLVGEGPTRTLIGPGNPLVRATGTPSQTNTDILRRFINSSNTRINQVGASRGPAEVVAPPNVWVVDVHATGRLCVLDTTRLITWRSDTMRAMSLTVASSASGEQQATLDYNEGQSLRRWPSDQLPVADGGSTFSIGGGDGPARSLTLVPVGPLAEDATAEDVVALLAANDCNRQIELMGALLAE